MTKYLPFDPHPRPPARAVPALSCDSQFHVLGPPERYPVRSGAVYEMPSATVERALRMHRTLGIERGVIVQATTYGADHRVVLDGLAVAGPNYRGCANAAVFAAADDSYLDSLNAAGVRGARFTRQGLGLALSPDDFQRAIARVSELGWYAKFQPEPDGIMASAAMIDGLDMPVLIDHLGRPDPRRGADDPTLRQVSEWLRRGNYWVMLSLVEKVSKAGPPWDDVIPIARAYIEAAPDRVVWASDWPHPVSTTQPPNEGALIDFLDLVVANDQERHRILVDNPARLFGFNT